MGLALVLEIVREVNGGHAASAEFFLDGVAVGAGGGETVREIWHCVLAPVATVLEYMFGS